MMLVAGLMRVIDGSIKSVATTYTQGMFAHTEGRFVSKLERKGAEKLNQAAKSVYRSLGYSQSDPVLTKDEIQAVVQKVADRFWDKYLELVRELEEA